MLGESEFDKDADDFLQVVVELVQGGALRAGAGKARNEADEYAGLRAPFDDCGIGSHGALRKAARRIIGGMPAGINRSPDRQAAGSLRREAVEQPVAAAASRIAFACSALLAT